MEYVHWWGKHLHWFWIVPFLFMILMFVCATLMARRTGYWRCCVGRSGREQFDWGKPGPRPVADRWSETPSQILDRRYASGEITKKQYEQIRHDIESSPLQSGPGDIQ